MSDPRPTSILETIKETLLIVGTYDAFDNQLIDYINSSIAIIAQCGYAPAKGFEITGYSETWGDLVTESRFNMVKTFIKMRVRLLFDPPSSSFALSQLKEDIEEFEWRIRAEVETGE